MCCQWNIIPTGLMTLHFAVVVEHVSLFDNFFIYGLNLFISSFVQCTVINAGILRYSVYRVDLNCYVTVLLVSNWSCALFAPFIFFVIFLNILYTITTITFCFLLIQIPVSLFCFAP